MFHYCVRKVEQVEHPPLLPDKHEEYYVPLSDWKVERATKKLKAEAVSYTHLYVYKRQADKGRVEVFEIALRVFERGEILRRRFPTDRLFDDGRAFDGRSLLLRRGLLGSVV